MFGNLLNAALSVIPGQTVQWLRFQARAFTPAGKPISLYHPAVPLYGSWQAVDADTMQMLGLDVKQVHRVLYVSAPVDSIQRGKGADRLVADGYYYEVVGDADWYNQDGWRRIVATRQEPVAAP